MGRSIWSPGTAYGTTPLRCPSLTSRVQIDPVGTALPWVEAAWFLLHALNDKTSLSNELTEGGEPDTFAPHNNTRMHAQPPGSAAA
ncbi:hypothetical protein EYF80_045122 [Liparis tanakae]|uniref:Uncharacterized protein n=1 Tax=Liparis tanakae TaxID=230148 RepID=A0A4Z2FV60_9TELE|nr:hypothetical protein EYF80_045122 [Liparis tanakae]